MGVPERTRRMAEERGIDPEELHQRVQEGMARYEAGEARDAQKYRWRRRWWRLRSAPAAFIWHVRLQRLRRRKLTKIYVSGRDERGTALLNRLRDSGYYPHQERDFSGYHRFGAEVDACDALLFMGEDGHASAHRSLMSLYIASGHTVALGFGEHRERPLADKPRPRPIFVLELWNQGEPPGAYAGFFEAHPEIVFLKPEAREALAQISEALPAATRGT
jgi:hypothetical protein